MNQSDNCSNDISVMNQDSKINGKLDTIEGQLSFMGEGPRESLVEASASVAKDDSSYSMPTLTMFNKKFDDSQDSQDSLRAAPDLPNGHNNPDAVDIAPRTKVLDEFSQESESLPDTDQLRCTKDDPKSAGKSAGNNSEQSEKKTVAEDKNSTIHNSEHEVNNKEPAKGGNDEVPILDESKSDPVANENEDRKKNVLDDEMKIEGSTKPERGRHQDLNNEDSLELDLSDSQFPPLPHPQESKENVKPELETKKLPGDDEKEEDDQVDDEAQQTSEDAKSSADANLEDNEEAKSGEPPEECHCTPECHMRMKLLKNYLGNACNQLKEYINQKNHGELTNFLELLNEIKAFAENKNTDVSKELLNDALQEDATQNSKKRKPRASKVVTKLPPVSTPKKEIAEKKSRVREAKKAEPISETTLKNIKGLAVFAKWPNSGWYYPGIIEGLTNSDWKDAANVTVKFYDGLVREMKNINILPAHLIPESSVVCDLDDETEMIVISTNRVDNNCVEFVLGTKEGTGKNLEVNFIKLAIKAFHMKAIKQQLEPNMDVMPKKMHMVSLDNLVSGRRSRIRTHKDDDDENVENTTPRKNVRKSVAPDTEKSAAVAAGETNVTTPAKLSPNKRGLTAIGRSTPKRKATPSKRMKQ